MKAILLSAGLGTRLYPITKTLPKCMVEVNGKPLLGWWIELLEKYGFNDVLINTHKNSEVILRYLDEYKGVIKFKVVHEKYLLGSAGTLLENSDFFDSKPILIAYSDNLTNINLKSLIDYHLSKKEKFTIVAQESCDLVGKGVIEIKNGLMTSFQEKPDYPIGSFINNGIYIFEKDILRYIQNKVGDIGFDILPKIVGLANVWVHKNYLIDIGTIKSLNQANLEWINLNDVH
jgi:mannose-1-phosphate guanylyltransferase